jgi:hypothetical protein
VTDSRLHRPQQVAFLMLTKDPPAPTSSPALKLEGLQSGEGIKKAFLSASPRFFPQIPLFRRFSARISFAVEHHGTVKCRRSPVGFGNASDHGFGMLLFCHFPFSQ